MAKSTTLNVWMNGFLVGNWSKTRTGDTFQYAPDWLDSDARRPLSLSMPFPPGNIAYRGPQVTSYFDNLLPDSEPIRRRLASRYKTAGLDAFAMLTELGRDCVGAIQLLPDGVTPTGIQQITAAPLPDSAVAERLRQAVTPPALGGAHEAFDLRLSIAGAQEKTALLFHQGQWQLPQGSTPTTHIFKLPLGLIAGIQADMSDSVENEWLCSKIVEEYGLPIAHCDIGRFEDQKALIVTRFDRRIAGDGSWFIRLPQEDLAQATGTPPHKKYQSDGGPGITDIMNLLLGSVNA
ncbi:HipA domain-containing protein, partial [Paludibacterium sp.]|uniref:HipA domain-containing protein n=1 Tax=Paludibacterium sp. TaxID=1917523 RepID=UPI0025E709B7